MLYLVIITIQHSVTNIHFFTMDVKTFACAILFVFFSAEVGENSLKLILQKSWFEAWNLSLTVNGIKCYSCTACADNGKEEECLKEFNTCQTVKITDDKFSRSCFIKGGPHIGGVEGVGCNDKGCVCDTDLCNGSAIIELKPILVAITAVLTKFVL